MNKNLVLLTFIFILGACMEAASVRNPASAKQDASVGTDGSGGDNLTGGDDSLKDSDTVTLAKVEIRHLIEPKVDDSSTGGDHLRKLTIPKNYGKFLYLAGINVTTLNADDIKVRFNFGVNVAPITVQATISSAPGLTPQTDVQVLVMDLRDKPFEQIQLIYDLYDYNNYDFADTSGLPGILTEPVDSNRNDKLFCRGLSLKDDPTFTGQLTSNCVGAADVCKYAYAKIVDKGLVKKSTLANIPDQPIVPSEVNVESLGNHYDNDTDALKIKRCLPDDPALYAAAYRYDGDISFVAFESLFPIPNFGDHYYRGPYRPIHADQWAINGEALKGEYGIFGKIYDDNLNTLVDDDELEYGFQSKLFPIYTKMNLPKDSEYLGNVAPHGAKSILTMASNGTSQWMDGCNERVSTVHEITGEHIGSCNVTATIEIISIKDGRETIVDTTNEVKLQLVKPIDISPAGDDVLLSSFQSCSSTNQCGADSCCINKRCWSKSIVSQCVEDLPNFGNAQPGNSCASDYECASLCCNESSGKCAPHDTNRDEPILCSKASGQRCVADDWCGKQPVTFCNIVKTGFDAQGGVTCALRCVVVEKHGDCKPQNNTGTSFGICVPPAQPAQPVFNPQDPNRCASAVNFDDFVQSVQSQ